MLGPKVGGSKIYSQHMDYFELKLLKKQCRRSTLTLLSVSLKAGNKSPEKRALPESGSRKTPLSLEIGNSSQEACINKPCDFFN